MKCRLCLSLNHFTHLYLNEISSEPILLINNIYMQISERNIIVSKKKESSCKAGVTSDEASWRRVNSLRQSQYVRPLKMLSASPDIPDVCEVLCHDDTSPSRDHGGGFVKSDSGDE